MSSTNRTQLQIVNAAKKPVTVFLTLGATPGCLQQVSGIPFIQNVLSPLVGSFVLPPGGASVGPYAPGRLGFNGNLSFNTQPLNCPTPQFPAGVNLFEFIINNFFQGAAAQETVDISCVAGVNCLLQAALSGPTWNAGPTQPNVTKISNSRVGANSGRVGVFPYGCDDCTASVAPPNCPGHPPYEKPQKHKICNVQRSASHGGGLVVVTYMGSA